MRAFSFSLILLGILFGASADAGSYSQSTTKSFGFGASDQNNCRLEVTRTGKANTRSFNAGATTRPSVRINERRGTRQTESVATLLIGNGLRGSIEVDGEAVEIRCRILPGTVELEISLATYEGPPISPTRVGVTRRATSRLSSSINVTRGQKVEIGSIVRDLRAKEGKVGTGGISREHQRQRIREQVYIKVL